MERKAECRQQAKASEEPKEAVEVEEGITEVGEREMRGSVFIRAYLCVRTPLEGSQLADDTGCLGTGQQWAGQELGGGCVRRTGSLFLYAHLHLLSHVKVLPTLKINFKKTWRLSE